MSWGDSWDDAAAASGFGFVGRPRGGEGLVSPRGGGAGFGFESSPDPNFSILPLSEGLWGAESAPYVEGWSQRVTQPGRDAANKILEDANAALADHLNGDAGGGTAAGTGTQGEGWDIQNQWNSSYEATSAKTGVPANLIKAIQGKETGKFWQGQDGYGAICPTDPGGEVLNANMGCVATNTGIYEDTAKSYGLDFNRIVNDPEYAIYATGVVLNGIAQSDAGNFDGPSGQTVLEYGGWEAVAGVYFGGSVRDNFVDGNQQDSVGYIKDVMGYVDELGGLGVGPGPASGVTDGTSPIGSISGVSSIWGGTDAPVTQDLGSHDGEVYNNDPTIYDYAKAYGGFDGHPGIDYGLPIGTPIVSPISGTVVYTGTAPDGKQYYRDGAGGIGEVRLQAPNGDIIILGHMATSNLKAGDTVRVGQLIGTSGQSDPRPESAHLHLEVRVLQPDGGYRIADPRTYFGGTGGGGEVTQPAPTSPPPPPPPPPAVTPIGDTGGGRDGGGGGRGYEQPPMI
jgi:hypothetical protein